MKHLAVGFVILLLTSNLSAAEPACDPAVERALAESSYRGVEAEVAIIRHPEQGIRHPDSILDFSCVEDLFHYRPFDMLFDPGRSMSDLLGLLQKQVCAAANRLWDRYGTRNLYEVRQSRGLRHRADPLRDTVRR